jgi:hypothetical protein
MKRLAVLISIVALCSLALATPAMAAAPGNDDASAPTLIGSLPYTQDPPLDTTEATADPDDPDCFGSGTNASVWYAFTTGPDPITLRADTYGSDYETNITVTSGSPTGEIVACGFGGAQFPAEANTAYFFMVAACFNAGGVGGEVGPAAIGCDPEATGGSLVFSLNEAPPPPEVDLTVNPVGAFNKLTGSATVSGTVLCTGEAFYSEIYVELTQTVGRFTVLGYADLYPDAFACDGTAHAWSAEVLGITGQFKGGRASAAAYAAACGETDCGFDQVEQSVRLR